MKNKKTDWKHIYNDFPVNNKFIWLNNCGVAPPCKAVTDSVKKYIDQYALNCILDDQFSFAKIKNSIQNTISELLNCEKNDVAIIHNTAEGMNFISHGLSLKYGDEILLMENEYPSNVYPWEHWENKEIILKTIPLGNSPELFIRNLKNTITNNTKVVTVSAVHWCTGMPLPLAEISRICKNSNIEFIVDAAQGAGHINIDMKEMGLDYLCFSAWKWLTGPLGLGILIIKKEKLNKLEYIFKGSDSVAGSKDYFPYKKDLKKTAERYMYSSPNFNDWVYFESALNYLKDIGFENVRNRIFELAGYFTDKIRKYGFKTVYNRENNQNTGIVVIDKENVDFIELSNKLAEHNIIAKERLGKLRIAPHIFNSFKQLDETADTINKIIQG